MGESREEAGLRLRSCKTLNAGVAMVNGQHAGMDAALLDDKIRVTGLQCNPNMELLEIIFSYTCSTPLSGLR